MHTNEEEEEEEEEESKPLIKKNKNQDLFIPSKPNSL